MINAAVSDVRRFAKILVEREEIRSQSRMIAYDRVGSQVGASGMWVRRFVKGYEGAGLTFIVAQNIVALYDGVCSRIEENTKAIDRDESHAAIASNPSEFVGESSALLPPNDY